MNRGLYLITIAMLLAVVACTKDVSEPPPPFANDNTVQNDSTGNDTLEVCDTVDWKFSAGIKPLIENNCAISGCHVSSSGNGIPYENYEQIKQKAENGKLRTRVLDEKSMPPGNPLSEEDRQKISCWLDAGFPDN